MITEQGRYLATALGLEQSTQALNTCSLIARATKTYIECQVKQCNGAGHYYVDDCPPDAYVAEFNGKCFADEQKLERRIMSLVFTLGAGYAVLFEGNPLGYCVFIVCPDGRIGNDTIGKRGVPARND